MKFVSTHIAKAPEIYGDFWFNSEPLSIHALQGQVILLIFWDYTSAPSLRLLSVIDEWHERYKEMGLVVIGIHSPEFPFGHDPRRIERAIHELGIRFPVTTDNSRSMGAAFRIQELPTLFVLDREGNIRSAFSHEVGYEQAERVIQSLLRDAGYHGELPMLAESLLGYQNLLSNAEETILQSRLQHLTPTLLTGYLHGALGNIEGYSRELPAEYSDPKFYLDGKFYAQGNWIAKRDAFETGQDSGQNYVVLRYSAGNVDGVIASSGNESVIHIEHDDRPIATEFRGDDIVVDEAGDTVLKINEPKLFNIIKTSELGEHTLKLMPSSAGISFYSFSFDNGLLRPFNLLRRNSFRNN
jgi:thiol-disulfide isomerase/thioredoxin